MSIVMTMNEHMFIDKMGDDFTYEAAQKLYEYYDELSDSMEEPFMFDRVAIRCEWVEYASLREAFNDYCGEPEAGEKYTYKDAKEYLEERTTIIILDNGRVLVIGF